MHVLCCCRLCLSCDFGLSSVSLASQDCLQHWGRKKGSAKSSFGFKLRPTRPTECSHRASCGVGSEASQGDLDCGMAPAPTRRVIDAGQIKKTVRTSNHGHPSTASTNNRGRGPFFTRSLHRMGDPSNLQLPQASTAKTSTCTNWYHKVAQNPATNAVNIEVLSFQQRPSRREEGASPAKMRRLNSTAKTNCRATTMPPHQLGEPGASTRRGAISGAGNPEIQWWWRF